MLHSLKFIDSKSAIARPDAYICINVDVTAILKSWRLSVFSYEWLSADDTIKTIDALTPVEQEKRLKIDAAMQAQEPLEKPVLGIGLQDNVEIGSGRAVLLTLAAHGLDTIPVHIPKSNESDFKAFLADVS